MPPEREYSKQEKVDLQVMRDLAELVGHKAWTTYVNLLNKHKIDWHNKLMQPISDASGSYASEYAKGAVYGLTQATDLPAIIIEGIKKSILPPKDEE